MLGAFSKKHIFIPKPPSASLIRARLQDFRNRVKWAACRECRGDAESQKQLPLVPRRVWECKKWVPAVVGPFIGAVSGLVYQKLEKLMHVRPKLPAFVVAGRKWLKLNGMVCVPSDKDGVFALAPRPLLNKLIYKELGKPCYRGYSPLSLEGECTSLKAHLRAAARVAERLSLPWGDEIRSSADRVTESSLLDSLMATVKTHKEPISVRLIHNSSGNCMNALGEALNRILTPRCSELWHLCTSSEDVAAKIRGIDTSARCLLVKQDIKDFYLAGSHQFILSEVSASFENKAERQFVVCALEALLNYQFVSQSFDKGSEHHTVYRVQQGCGIGKNYSGALADWFFFQEGRARPPGPAGKVGNKAVSPFS